MEGDGKLEEATIYMAKGIAVMKVLQDGGIVKDGDKEVFEGVRKQLSGRLRDKMLAAISSK